MFCSTFLAFSIGVSRTPATFKMKLFVTKVNGLKLLLLERVPSYVYVKTALQVLDSIDFSKV